ncbi:MAG: hypothetical protein PF482_07850 [Desulfobacteraceae bacterium]|jgi:hypothetical protein|nr:hypothetical protein [Desulfobacteraceae bacterium]
MQQITIRGIAPEIEQKIRQIAKSKHQSINQVLKEIIHKEFEKQGHKPKGASLKELAGGWSKKETDDFHLSVQSCNQIDEDMWR